MIECIGRVLVHAQRQIGLRQARVLLDIEQKRRKLVGAIVALGVDAADHKVEADGEPSEERRALGGTNGHERVRLEIEALDELAYKLRRLPRRHARLVIRPQVLIHATQRE